MPQYDWAKMADNQRNLLVAEKVMELSESDFRWMWPAFCNYTTNLSAAWQVVEKMKEDFYLEIRVGQIAESAQFTKYGTGSVRKFIGQCTTAPESICLAALRAKGVDV